MDRRHTDKQRNRDGQHNDNNSAANRSIDDNGYEQHNAYNHEQGNCENHDSCLGGSHTREGFGKFH